MQVATALSTLTFLVQVPGLQFADQFFSAAVLPHLQMKGGAKNDNAKIKMMQREHLSEAIFKLFFYVFPIFHTMF